MRLLLVDDEHYIVNYLSNIIEEEQIPGLEVYKSYSGPEALSVIKTSFIDLILLDIHMPGMTGIEVAGKIQEISPRSRILFLTAYDNFEHIYESNKLKNTRYLLKTEDDEVILAEVKEIIKELELENDKLLLLSEAQEKALLLSHLLQQNILQGIMAGYPLGKLERELSLAGADFKLDLHQSVYLMYIQTHYKTLNEIKQNNSSQLLKQLQLLNKMLNGKFKFSMLDLGKGASLLFLQSLNNSSTDFEFLQSVANDFSDYHINKYEKCVTTVLYPETSDWNDVCSHFNIMQQYVESSISEVPTVYSDTSISDNHLLEEEQLKSLSIPVTIDRLSLDRKLQELAFSLNQGIETDYLHILKHIGSECIRIRSMHCIPAIKIYTSISLMLMEYTDLHQLQEQISTKIALYPLYQMNEFSSWKKAFLYLETLSNHIFDIINSTKLDRNEELVKKIKSYIRNNLGGSLTLTTISRVVHYNEAYISRLFKQTNGIGISEYVSQKRINKSKELLVSTTNSMQTIALATGFDTAQYFSIVFKKTTGMSPSEYRRSYLG